MSASPPETVEKPAIADPCSNISGKSERLLCQNDNLASLDRQLSGFYRQSWDRADERKRQLLAQTRQRFIDRRDACDSSGCMTTAYVARLREIGEIMAGRTAP